MTIIDGKKTAAEIRQELKKKIDRIKSEGRNVPGLVTILIGEDPASQVYVRSKIKDCEEIGMRTRAENHSGDITERELIDLVTRFKHIILPLNRVILQYNIWL